MERGNFFNFFLTEDCKEFLRPIADNGRGLPQLKNIQMKKNNKGYFLIGEANAQPYVTCLYFFSEKGRLLICIMNLNKIINENCLQGLKKLPDNSIDCCITSPPYYGLRDYGTATWIGGDENCNHQRKKHGDECKTGQRNVKGGSGDGIYKEICSMCGAIRQDEQIGLEKTPEEYVKKLTELFEEVRRVLKPTGTLWLNIGDSFARGKSRYSTPAQTLEGGGQKDEKYGVLHNGERTDFKNHSFIKDKDLIGVPWMLAFALRNSGWYLRMDIIWNKPNPMPESVKDRPTKAHEYIFLMTKEPNYFYDYQAIQTETIGSEHDKHSRQSRKRFPTDKVNGIRKEGFYPMANKRSVWTVTTKPYNEAHFATFPEDLIEDCILAGCPEEVCNCCGIPREKIIEMEDVLRERKNKYGEYRAVNGQPDQRKEGAISKIVGLTDCGCGKGFSAGIVLDPFMGSGTTALVAKKKNRNFVGFELNPEYIKIAEKRLDNEIGMFL